jgi:peptidoglycan/xylan/chitin deacetylase (PgdA/CDA1 family)
MFYIGSNVVNWPYGAQRGVVDGHHIAGHTWSHKMMTTLTNQEVLAELYYTQKAIKYVTGVTPKYWRPVCIFFVQISGVKIVLLIFTYFLPFLGSW